MDYNEYRVLVPNANDLAELDSQTGQIRPPAGLSLRLARRQNLRQTYDYLPYARNSLMHTRLDMADAGTMRHEPLYGGPLPDDEERAGVAKLYKKYTITYWDEARAAVAHGNIRYVESGMRTSRKLHDESLSTIWTGDLDLTQFSMVLDVAHPKITLSLNRSESFARKIAEEWAVGATTILHDGVVRRRGAYNRVKAEAKAAVLMYAERTRGLRLGIDPVSATIAQLVAEVDHHELGGGFLPESMPNAAAINTVRARRFDPLTKIGGAAMRYIPGDVRKKGAEFAEYGR